MGASMTSLYLITHTAWGKRWFRIVFWWFVVTNAIGLINASAHWLQH